MVSVVTSSGRGPNEWDASRFNAETFVAAGYNSHSRHNPASISKMNQLGKNSVAMLTIGEDGEGQRIDNFLLKHLKGVPKSHIYRILRKGEVRANKKRVHWTHSWQTM